MLSEYTYFIYPKAFSIIAALCMLMALPSSLRAQTPGAATESKNVSADTSPWGIASGAEWAGDYPRFNPLLRDAGVQWVRLFPEWQTIEPRKGEWDWKTSDVIVADVRRNNLHLLVTWAYFAPWASADGGTRQGPIKNMQDWRDYIHATVDRYHKEVKYWEVWNEFNGSFYQSPNKVRDYADLVVAAYDTAKQIDPNARIGLSVANFDLGFLDAVIKAGAADHFDFICVHPYENLGAIAEGGEQGYLSLTENLRKMLVANHQRVDIPLWITEIGSTAPVKPEEKRDAAQAEMLTKAYLLAIAQGFQRVFWFEARGPSYGKEEDFGILRPDWSKRPAYDALKTMTSLLGSAPRPLGWLNLGNGGYGFLFKGAQEDILAAWSPAEKQRSVRLDATVALTDLTGKRTTVPAGQAIVLTTRPIFVSKLPPNLIREARSHQGKPYPWGGDYAHARVVSCRLGATNADNGLQQINPNTTVVVNGLTDTYRRTDIANPSLNGEGHYVYFRVGSQFVPYGTKKLEITIVAKRVAPDKVGGMGVLYESVKGYVGGEGYWTIPADDQWHKHTWRVNDANFVGQWGWNFRFDAAGSPSDYLIKEVRVSKLTL